MLLQADPLRIAGVEVFSPHGTRQPRHLGIPSGMAAVVPPLVRPDVVTEPESSTRDALEPGFLVVCWNDPVNFMDFVTHVFQRVFGWNRQKAEHHMKEVHEKGKSVLVRETLEKAEFYVHQLQKFSLHATLERDS